MFSYYDDAPAQIKESELARISKETKLGVYDPLPEIRSNIEHKAREERRNLITIGLTTGFLGSIGLGTAFSLTAPLIMVIAGGCVVVFAGKGIVKYSQVKRDLKHDELAPYLSDDELEDLDTFQQSFKPSNIQAKEAHEFIKNLCDELLEDEGEEVETIDAKAEVVKGATEPVRDDDKGNPVKEEKPPLRTPNDVIGVDNPWLKDAKLTEVKAAGNDVKKLTLREDSFIDKVDKEVEASVKNQLGEELNEIRMVQGEQMQAVNERIEDLKIENTELKNLLLDINSRLQTGVQADLQTEITTGIQTLPRSPGADPDLLSGPLSVGLHGGEKTEIIVPDVTINLDVNNSDFKPEFDITGWSVERFKKEVNPGVIQPEDVIDPVVKRKAIARVYECQKKYDRTSPEFAVWYVFGMKRKSGDKRYEATATFCKKIIEYWRNNLRGKNVKCI